MFFRYRYSLVLDGGVEERKNVFVKAWYEINMGEKLVANWIAFARDNVPLSRDFHMMAHNQQM